MVADGNFCLICCRRSRVGLLNWVVLGLWVGFVFLQPVVGLRPLRERALSWGDEVCIQIAFISEINFDVVVLLTY